MKKIVRVLPTLFLVIIASGFLSVTEAAEQGSYCYLEARHTDVRVEVWDLDKLGNKGQLIWKGVIRKGQRKQIQTSDGRLRYGSTTYIDKNVPLSGDRSRWCHDGNIIGVP
jgi:hypothetical protein